jgi:hypothetical protein
MILGAFLFCPYPRGKSPPVARRDTEPSTYPRLECPARPSLGPLLQSQSEHEVTPADRTSGAGNTAGYIKSRSPPLIRAQEKVSEGLRPPGEIPVRGA